MRILIISTFYPPLNSIASLRAYSWAKYWSLDGHEVTVLTTEKAQMDKDEVVEDFPHLKVIEIPLPSIINSIKTWFRRSENSSPQQKRNEQNTTYWLKRLFIRLRTATGVFNACRLPDLTHLWIEPAFNAVRKLQPWDLVVSTSGPYPVHLVGLKIKKEGLTKQWIADFRDLWVDNHIFPGLWPFKIVEKHLENRIVTQANFITTVSSDLAQRIESRYPKIRAIVIENGCDPEDFRVLPEDSIFPNDGKLRIVYTGSIYDQQNPVPLFQAIEELSKSAETKDLLNKLEVVFVGSYGIHLERMIANYSASGCIHYRGVVSRSDALRMQRDAHWLLFLPWANQKEEGILTGKLFEYLCSQTPILSIGPGFIEESQRFILRHNAGVCLGNDVEEIKRFLIDTLSVSGAKQHTAISPAILTTYSRRNKARQFLDLATNQTDTNETLAGST